MDSLKSIQLKHKLYQMSFRFLIVMEKAVLELLYKLFNFYNMYFSFNVLDIITLFENNQPVVSCSCLTFLFIYIFVVLMLVS
jgi:hypothetical protein